MGTRVDQQCPDEYNARVAARDRDQTWRVQSIAIVLRNWAEKLRRITRGCCRQEGSGRLSQSNNRRRKVETINTNCTTSTKVSCRHVADGQYLRRDRQR